ncbi:hypothetical protein Ahy_B01g052056 [Arachis hypogaea]|uniref:Ubiquitin-like protease family profile domain-containing protein n=1 Tax=Arachis hypogaea TaxID=3818 RepID=A0A445ANI1_ARAHY|nr:hypothetical protein Ahy_B01g052056 [Arachis hypogaea]
MIHEENKIGEEKKVIDEKNKIGEEENVIEDNKLTEVDKDKIYFWATDDRLNKDETLCILKDIPRAMLIREDIMSMLARHQINNMMFSHWGHLVKRKKKSYVLLPDDFGKNGDSFFEQKEIPKHRWLLVPCCYDYHWWLYAYDIYEKRLFILDFLYKEAKGDRVHLDIYASKLIQQMVSIAVPNYELPKNDPIPIYLNLPRQSNNYDCGLFVIKWVEIVVKSTPAQSIPYIVCNTDELMIECLGSAGKGFRKKALMPRRSTITKKSETGTRRKMQQKTLEELESRKMIECRCSPISVFTTINSLTFDKMGFSSMKAIQDWKIDRWLFLALSKAYNTTISKLELVVGDIDVTTDKIGFALGLPSIGKSFPEEEDWTSEQNRLVAPFKSIIYYHKDTFGDKKNYMGPPPPWIAYWDKEKLAKKLTQESSKQRTTI